MFIAATDELAREIRIRENLKHKETGEKAWSCPAVYSLRQWLIEQWESTFPESILLSHLQEVALALHTLHQNPPDPKPIAFIPLARRLAYSARLVKQYQIDLNDEYFEYEDHYALFREWYRSMESKKTDCGWITFDDIPFILRREFDNGNWAPPDTCEVFGFDHPTPLVSELFQLLETCGTNILKAERPHIACENPSASVYESIDDEVRATANTIRELLVENNDSSERLDIGVLVPSYEVYGDIIETSFRDILSPESKAVVFDPHSTIWRLRKGRSLDREDIISVALDIANLDNEGNSINLVSRILLSDKICCSDDSIDRAKVEYALRKTGYAQVSVQDLINCVEERVDAINTPGFANQFDRLKSCLMMRPERALPSEWATHLVDRLGILSWPGNSITASRTRKVVSAFNDVLLSLSVMDAQLNKISYQEYLFWIREALGGREFRERDAAFDPVRILEYTDIEGARFSHIFVLGMTAGHFPCVAAPDPFIPLDIQKRLNMPQASPAIALKEASHIQECFLHSCSYIAFNAYKVDNKGITQIPSPLIKFWKHVVSDGVDQIHNLQHYDQDILIKREHTFPAVTDHKPHSVDGGVSVLASHAHMPFFSFLKHRLDLNPFPSPSSGLDARIQGILAHELLHRLWSELKTQAALKDLSNDDLTQRLSNLIKTLFEKERLLRAVKCGVKLMDLEMQRLLALLLEWLDIESKRAHSFEVMLTESPIRACIDNMSLNLKLDRMDCLLLPNGSKRYLLIDYKTRDYASPKDWLPDTLSEPQLPIYASFSDFRKRGIDRTDGIAFGFLVRGHCKFVVWSNFADRLVPDARKGLGTGHPNWQNTLEEWRTALNSMAAEYMAGSGDIDISTLKKRGPYAYLFPLAQPFVEQSQ